ncbi:MAG: hypothetical protein ABW215_07310 [Kibdelosporangium sp.]
MAVNNGTANNGPADNGPANNAVRRGVAIGLAFVAAAGVLAMSAGSASAAPARPVGVNAVLDVGIPAAAVPPSGRFIPPHVQGDREFDGHGPDVRVDAALVLTSRTVDTQLHMRARETRSDWTTADGTRSFRMYTAPAGWCVTGVNTGTFDSLQYRDTDHAADVFGPQDPFSFISGYDVIGDTSGDDAGVDTGVAVTTRPFTVHLASC